jgi:hypothetical protein
MALPLVVGASWVGHNLVHMVPPLGLRIQVRMGRAWVVGVRPSLVGHMGQLVARHMGLPLELLALERGPLLGRMGQRLGHMGLQGRKVERNHQQVVVVVVEVEQPDLQIS